jgi:hypothetical protein
VFERIGVVAAATALLVGGMIGSAGHAVADDDSTYAMPDIEGMGLDKAVDGVRALNPEFRVNLGQVLHFSQKPTVLPNWKVCWQSPTAGEEVDEDTWIGVGVTRKGTACY